MRFGVVAWSLSHALAQRYAELLQRLASIQE